MFKSLSLRAARRVAQPSSLAARHLHTPVAFDWKDPLGAHNLYTEEETAIAEVAEEYCQERMLPRVLGKRDAIHTLSEITQLTPNRRGLP